MIAIDGNSLINRAYYALPPLMTKEGLYTNGVYGFLSMLHKLREEYKPAYMIVAFDRKAPTFRHLDYEQYKAGRKKTPAELLSQFPLVKESLSYLKIPSVELDGFEADDLIGTAVRLGQERGLSCMIVTGDKDALQLVSESTRVMITKKGISEFEMYDLEAMQARYQMTPQQFVDLKGLMGDASDNIPGIPGVGEKTGMSLIHQFGSVEALLEHTDQIKSEKLRQKVEENAQLALMSKRLARINTQVPVDIDFSLCRCTQPDWEALTAQFQRLELFSLLARMKKDKDSYGGTLSVCEKNDGAKNEPPHDALFIINSHEEFPQNLKQALGKAGTVYLKVFGDVNHVEKSQVYGMSLLFDEQGYFLSGPEHTLEAAKVICENRVSCKGHFLKDSYFMLRQLGAEGFFTAFDSGIAQYVAEPGRSDYSLSSLASAYLNREIQEEKAFYKDHGQMDFFSGLDQSLGEYGLLRCQTVRELEPILEERLKAEEVEEVYRKIELPLVEIFADMEYQGFKVDKEALLKAGKEMRERIEDISQAIFDLAKESFNINSPKQLGTILFEKLGLKGGKKTKTGYSTSADVLEKLKEKHPIIPLILEYRSLTKLNGTYIEGLLPLISPADGKIRAHFQQTGAATGRISCTEPNLQNIPIRHEEGRLLRKAFTADGKDHVLVDADYSQIELRVLAHLSGDEGLLEAFRQGQDIHKATAARVFEVPEDQVTPLQRSSAKAVNFGVIYGMSGFGLSENLGISRQEAQRYIEEYFKKYTGVKTYMDGVVAFCKERGYVTTIFQRRRYIPEIKASNYMTRQFGERLAMNSPIQGSAADIIKIAMIRVFEQLRDRGLRSRLVLQVHDELIIDGPIEEEAQVRELLKENMMAAAQLAIPLEVGMESGSTWYEAK